MSLSTEPSQPDERAAHDLPPKSYAEAAEEALEEPRKVQPIKAEHFEGAGLDSSPKSPTRGHRRKTSLKSNGSIGRKHGEHIYNETFAKHADANGRTLTSLKPPAGAKPLARRDSALQTGRQAGAGWSRSKYVPFIRGCPPPAPDTPHARAGRG